MFGPLSVKTAMLTMLVEFFLVHATGFFTGFANVPDSSRWQRSFSLLGLSLFYLLMIAAFARSFGTWWPLLAFVWLLVGKIVQVWSQPVADDGAMFRQMGAWAGSVALYLFGCFATLVPDVPRWGMTVSRQPQFGLDMHSSGLWESEPHRVVAFGVLYFGLSCLVKLVIAMIGISRQRQTRTA